MKNRIKRWFWWFVGKYVEPRIWIHVEGCSDSWRIQHLNHLKVIWWRRLRICYAWRAY